MPRCGSCSRAAARRSRPERSAWHGGCDGRSPAKPSIARKHDRGGRRPCLEFRSIRRARPRTFNPRSIHEKVATRPDRPDVGTRPRRRRARRGHAEEDQGHRHDHRRRARVLGRARVHARRRQVHRLSLRRLRAHHRRRAEATRHGQAGDQVPAGDLAEPHPAGAERHRRYRVRLDHQQRHAPEGRRLRARPPTSRRCASRSRRTPRIKSHRRPERQDRRHHHRHHLRASCCARTSAPRASTSRSSTARTTPTASCCSSPAAPTPS